VQGIRGHFPFRVTIEGIGVMSMRSRPNIPAGVPAAGETGRNVFACRLVTSSDTMFVVEKE
jgi:hypothetical protein